MLKGTFSQKAALARLRHHTKIYAEHGERWMNAGELFNKVREDELFSSLDDNQLFNAVVYFYGRWEGPAQHKIHARPIAPTFGENVDKQTSLRTPNLGGGSRDEGAYLGYVDKYSDGIVDLQAISGLHKSEVYALARHLNLSDSTINAIPKGDMYDSRADTEVWRLLRLRRTCWHLKWCN